MKIEDIDDLELLKNQSKVKYSFHDTFDLNDSKDDAPSISAKFFNEKTPKRKPAIEDLSNPSSFDLNRLDHAATLV